MAKKKENKIPRFKSEAEEARWWDSHPDFIADQFEKAASEGRLLRGLPKSQNITIQIATSDLRAARKIAEQKGLPCHTYIKMLLHQALDRERPAR